jgi:hypothetical protein
VWHGRCFPTRLPAVRIQMHLGGNPGLLQGDEISQRIVHTVDVVILGLQQKRRRCPAGNVQIGVQRKIRVRNRPMFRMRNHKFLRALPGIPFSRV